MLKYSYTSENVIFISFLNLKRVLFCKKKTIFIVTEIKKSKSMLLVINNAESRIIVLIRFGTEYKKVQVFSFGVYFLHSSWQ